MTSKCYSFIPPAVSEINFGYSADPELTPKAVNLPIHLPIQLPTQLPTQLILRGSDREGFRTAAEEKGAPCIGSIGHSQSSTPASWMYLLKVERKTLLCLYEGNKCGKRRRPPFWSTSMCYSFTPPVAPEMNLGDSADSEEDMYFSIQRKYIIIILAYTLK